jgi:hypothetical protein
MPEAVVEAVVLLITHSNHAILYTKGVGIVIARFVVMDFYHPVGQVFTIEEWLPVGSGGFLRNMPAIVARGNGHRGK